MKEIKGLTKECEEKLINGVRAVLEIPEKKCEKCGYVILGGITGEGILFYQEHKCWKAEGEA